MKNILEAGKILLRGMSQVMLQNNIFTGLLFFAGVFYSSWLMGLGAVVGVSVSTYTAFVLNYSKQDITDGLYGFNGILVGIAVLYFYELTAITILMIILGSVLSSIVMNFMHEKKLSHLTFPFVLSTWILIFVMKLVDVVPLKVHETIAATSLNLSSSLSMGFGQVMFQANIITGILFLLGLLVNSRIAALYAFFGSCVGVGIGYFFSLPLSFVNAGIFGYNAVLCGIAFNDKKVSAIPYALIAIVLSIAIVYGMIKFNIVALTAPFVFASWIVLLLKK